MPLDVNDPRPPRSSTTWASAFQTIAVSAVICATIAFIVYVIAG